MEAQQEKMFRYQWIKPDGQMGMKNGDAEEILKFVVQGDRDRTLYAETQGMFMVLDSTGLRKSTFAEIIRTHLETTRQRWVSKAKDGIGQVQENQDEQH